MSASAFLARIRKYRKKGLAVGIADCAIPNGADRALMQFLYEQDMLKDVSFGDFEQFTFTGWNNETVHGYVVKPHDYVEGRKYPVAFLIHGGPQGSFGNGWSYRWNPETYAGAGYAVVMIDFHGSTGYGQKFTDSISGDWGGKPLEDLQKGLAAAPIGQPLKASEVVWPAPEASKTDLQK